MQVTITVQLPDNFTDDEVKKWSDRMIEMSSYYTKEIIRDRAEPIADQVRTSAKIDINRDRAEANQ